MKFSFLICTCNSERLIFEVLNSILKQTEISLVLEVIIVDYNSKDSTLEIANKLLDKSYIDLININCKFPGKSPALNQGLNAARGDYIVIVDDDNILHSSYLKVAKKILKDKNIGCVGAKGITDNKLKLSDWFNEFQSVYAIGLPEGDDWVWGAGSIINNKTWKELKKFDFQFLLNPERKSHSDPIFIGGEDVELALAIKLIGYKIVSNRNLTFIHKFKQNRITKEYLVKNSEGVSKSVSVHELYRTLIKYPNTSFPKFYWSYKIIRKICGCLLNIFICILLRKNLKRKVILATLKGIFLGFVKFYPSFDYEFTKLKKIIK